MAAYSGGQIADTVTDDRLTFCSLTIVNKTPTVISVCGIDDSSLAISGPRTDNLPVAMPENALAGIKSTTFLDDYYYRIHIVERNFSLGPILTDMERSFIVWNAWFETRICSVINSTGASDLILVGLTAPFVLNQLQHTDYIIQIPLDGIPVLDASYTFDFGVGEEIPVTIQGTRITLFVFRPQESVNESLESFTNILSPRYGVAKEQRIALRRIPRQSFRFSVLLTNEQLQARFENHMFDGQRRLWGVPVWTEQCIHTADIVAGVTAINLDTTYTDFRNDSLAVIWVSPTINEVVEILTVAVDSLTLNSQVTGNYSGGKLIIPLRLAKIDSSVQRRNISTGPATFDLSFLVQDNVLATGFAAAQTYKSLPVLINATPVDPTQDKFSDGEPVMVDYQTGAFELLMDNVHNRMGQAYLFYNDTKQACWNFRQFIHSLYGRQGCVWIPTFKPDMNLLATIASSDLNFTISNADFTKGMGLNVLRTNLAFIFPNGTIICREITGFAETDEIEEVVSIDSGPGVTINPGDCIISFLDKCRLSSDRVDLTWPMAHQNECALNFTAVKE